MATYRRVCDSHHLQADCQTGISSGTLRSVIEYGLPLPLFKTRINLCQNCKVSFKKSATAEEIGCIFTTRCYASAVVAMGLCPSVCVCHKSVFYRNG